MLLTLLGTATSQGIPVIACGCNVCQSTDPRDNRLRASALLSGKGKHFVIDTGPDFREQMLRNQIQEIEGVIITHEHYDHTAGLDDLRPFCFKQKIDMPVYCLPRVAADLRNRYAYAFSGYPGVPRLDIREVNFGDKIPFSGGNIELLEVLHGELPILGIRWGDLAYLTDAKELPARTLVQCKGIKKAVISALHHAGTHSHLSLDEAIAYLKQLGVDQGILTHFSHRMGRTAPLNAELPEGVECGWDGMRILVDSPAFGL
ncbi:MBL fold metallo-hydrolase [Neolewinella persica]|uniref:MBL fold metallo-hydrolase n=1 Tax=Neolewinella persica TaxID=70998 RepID=UPI00035C9680|nr:MBL fold metallo-hydrolase [Neolewinella persica]